MTRTHARQPRVSSPPRERRGRSRPGGVLLSVVVYLVGGGLFSLGWGKKKTTKHSPAFHGEGKRTVGLLFNPPAEAALGKADIYFPDYDSYAWSRSTV